MKNLKMMSDNSSDSSQFSSLVDSVLGNDRETRRMEKRLEILRTNLSKIEATDIAHRKIQTQTEGIPKNKKNILNRQLQVTKESVEQFQENLETLITITHEARTAQAAADVELSQLKTKMVQNLTEAAAFFQGEAVKQKQLFEEKISSLGQELVHMEWLGQQVMLLEGQRQDITPKVQESKSNKPNVTPAALNDKYHHLIQENENLKSQLKILRGERGEHDLRIAVGTYHVEVSDGRYFEIDWTKEYESSGGRNVRCKRCSWHSTKQFVAKDHVWSKHYGGTFKCAYCADSGRVYKNRSKFRFHIKRNHPSVKLH